MSEIPKFNQDQDSDITYGRPTLPENISEYAGHWVAVRGGKVIFASRDRTDFTSPEAFDHSTYYSEYYVPEPGTHYYLAA